MRIYEINAKQTAEYNSLGSVWRCSFTHSVLRTVSQPASQSKCSN